MKTYSLDGFMLGREAYKNPYVLSSVDKDIFEKKANLKTRYQIVMQMAKYIDSFMKQDEPRVHSVTRHMLGLYNGLSGAREWRRVLSEKAKYAKDGDILRIATDTIENVIQRKNVA
jgi:tRNA-dihydrouridine synthase A